MSEMYKHLFSPLGAIWDEKNKFSVDDLWYGRNHKIVKTNIKRRRKIVR